MIKLKFVLRNVYDKLKIQTTDTIVSSAYGGEMVASQIGVKMSNKNNTTASESQFLQCRNSALPYPLFLPWITRKRETNKKEVIAWGFGALVRQKENGVRAQSGGFTAGMRA